MTSHHVTRHVTAMSRASSSSTKKRKEKEKKIPIKSENKRKENKNCSCPKRPITESIAEIYAQKKLNELDEETKTQD